MQKSTVSQSCLQDCLDFAERMKRKALRVRSEGSIPPYETEAESRKQHSDAPLCNSLKEELPQLYQLHTIGGELDDEWSPGLEGVEQFARSCIGGVQRHM